jgi:hypothetical protein
VNAGVPTSAAATRFCLSMVFMVCFLFAGEVAGCPLGQSACFTIEGIISSD